MKVAIYGCGQLARMMAEAAHSLGVSVCFLAEPNEDTRCVKHLGTVIHIDPSHPTASLLEVSDIDVITVEREQLDLSVLQRLNEEVPIYPPIEALAKTQHRLKEKSLLTDLNLPTSPWVSSCVEPSIIAKSLRFPVVIKHPTQGYDGKSQWHAKTLDETVHITSTLTDTAVLIEERINFEFEVSIIAARDQFGDIVCYPVVENQHQDSILLSSIAPAPLISSEQQQTLERYARTLLQELNYVGVLTVECFVTQNGILINEIAPRVHNSGHWTLQSGLCSQFEQHIRAVAGMSLVHQSFPQVYGLVNILGPVEQDQIPTNTQCEPVWYGKENRPKRKLGHIALWAATETELLREQDALLTQLYPKEAVRTASLCSDKALPGAHVIDKGLTQTLGR